MTIINKEDSIYSIKIVTRYQQNNVDATIRIKGKNSISNHLFLITYSNGVGEIDLTNFNPVEDTNYELIINGLKGVMWMGQILYTKKDVQNYSTSPKNNLKF